VRYLHAIIHAALADALGWQLVPRNVANAATPPSHRAAKAAPPKTWSAGELRNFLGSVTEDRLYPLWLLDATTGLRRGEALGLWHFGPTASASSPNAFRGACLSGLRRVRVLPRGWFAASP